MYKISFKGRSQGHLAYAADDVSPLEVSGIKLVNLIHW